MDIDLIAKHMPGLLEFKKRVEALLEGAEAGSGTAAEALNGRIDDVRKELSDLGEHVAALQVSKDEAESFSERLTGMLDWFEANREGLEVLLSIGDDLAPKPDPAAAPIAEPTADPVADASSEQPAPAADQPVT
jgi:hypothetical protein